MCLTDLCSRTENATKPLAMEWAAWPFQVASKCAILVTVSTKAMCAAVIYRIRLDSPFKPVTVISDERSFSIWHCHLKRNAPINLLVALHHINAIFCKSLKHFLNDRQFAFLEASAFICSIPSRDFHNHTYVTATTRHLHQQVENCILYYSQLVYLIQRYTVCSNSQYIAP